MKLPAKTRSRRAGTPSRWTSPTTAAASGRGGAAAVSVDGKEVAKGRVERTIPIRVALDETLDVGEDCGTPVNLSYDVPFKFSGKIEKVNVNLK